jgi:hypothetical protein
MDAGLLVATGRCRVAVGGARRGFWGGFMVQCGTVYKIGGVMAVCVTLSQRTISEQIKAPCDGLAKRQ